MKQGEDVYEVKVSRGRKAVLKVCTASQHDARKAGMGT
jgi:hypothetical protein